MRNSTTARQQRDSTLFTIHDSKACIWNVQSRNFYSYVDRCIRFALGVEKTKMSKSLLHVLQLPFKETLVLNSFPLPSKLVKGYLSSTGTAMKCFSVRLIWMLKLKGMRILVPISLDGQRFKYYLFISKLLLYRWSSYYLGGNYTCQVLPS